MNRDGGAGSNSFSWVSKYGSVCTSFYDGGTADGMNEAGLVGNMLYLVESVYPEPDSGVGRSRPALQVVTDAWQVLSIFRIKFLKMEGRSPSVVAMLMAKHCRKNRAIDETGIDIHCHEH